MSSTEETEKDLRLQGVVPKLSSYQIQPVSIDFSKSIWSIKPPLPSFLDGCPPLIIGGSAFGKGISSKDEILQSDEPYRIIKTCFDYGIRAIDTSPYYHPSEISIGRILKTLSKDYPRNSFYIQTKVGRYGNELKDFDYSPERILKSIETSLERLGTSYLDCVILHDVEFICTSVGSSQLEGFTARDALLNKEIAKNCGLDQIDASKIHGPGDEKILLAIQTLFNLQEKGIIKNVGIGGYPLPTLLRLSRLISCKKPFKSVDVILNYCHHTLQNDLLSNYFDEFLKEPEIRKSIKNISIWKSPTILNASPFSMGLLTDLGPPNWHPANKELKEATKIASIQLSNNLNSIAAFFGLHNSKAKSTIIGMNSIDQVFKNISTFHQLPNSKILQDQIKAIEIFKKSNVYNWSWASP